MKCKFCLAEMEEEAVICPFCGKSQQDAEVLTGEEEAESVAEEQAELLREEAAELPAPRKAKLWKMIAAAVGGVVLLAVLILAILGPGMGIIKLKNISAFFGFTEAEIDYKDSYTVSDAKAEKKKEITIATMGDQTLTNGALQAYYWTGVFDFVSNYSYYLSSFGLDVSKPLDEQVYDEATGMTFQQFFLENALESWRRYATLTQMAEENNFQISAELQDYLDNFDQLVLDAAKENGYTDVEKFIDEEFFPGCSVAAYYEYVRMTYTALGYYDSLYESMMPTQQEIEDYYTENEATLTGKGYGKDAGNYYDVRHILVAIEGGTEGEDGAVTYSDEDWENCRAKAQKMLDDFLAGEATEEVFAELATKNSADPGSASSGGLYTQLTKDTSFIEGFKNWYLEEGRKAGDTGLVKNTESSVQGYHIMYFSDSSPIWEYQVRTQVLSEKTSALLEEAENKWSMEVNFKKIVLGEIALVDE